MNRNTRNQKGPKPKDNCLVCGSPLIYQTAHIPMTCTYCGREHAANIFCPEGHYVCDACHALEALGILKQITSSTKSSDPGEILEFIVSHPSVPMHGPEHHVMVPAVLLAAVKNAGYEVPSGAIDRAIERGAKVPGGWCGYYGACGAAVGVGIAVSVLTEATPLTGKPRSLAIEATSRALDRIADGYPRCCKRASRFAIETAVAFLRDRMGIDLDITPVTICTYLYRNRECPKDNCPYFTELGL